MSKQSSIYSKYTLVAQHGTQGCPCTVYIHIYSSMYIHTSNYTNQPLTVNPIIQRQTLKFVTPHYAARILFMSINFDMNYSKIVPSRRRARASFRGKWFVRTRGPKKGTPGPVHSSDACTRDCILLLPCSTDVNLSFPCELLDRGWDKYGLCFRSFSGTNILGRDSCKSTGKRAFKLRVTWHCKVHLGNYRFRLGILIFS